ncbi:MAG TPA: magnesium transporter CorA family protein [Paludibacter sp.]|nr:magnesium transporter CorA family protein [Paludibacter sp.]
MKIFYKNSNGLVPCKNWEPNCWVHVEKPTDEDVKYLVDELKMPIPFYNDIEDVDERPRIELEDGWTFIIIRIPHKIENNNVPFSTVPLGIIFKGEVFISICFYSTEMITDFAQYTIRKNIEKNNNFDFVLRLLLSSSVWFLKYLKQINNDINSAEKKLENSIRNQELQTMLKIEKCLVYFTTSLRGNDVLAHRIKNYKDLRKACDPELVEDVEIELRQALETTKIYSDILSGLMDAYASVISNNVNEIMKQLTSISIILMIPTLIASMYGMNVHNNLEEARYGFWIVLFISFMLSGLGVVLFRRKNWF